MDSKKHKIGLSLSGGGALGFAHLGAIQALEDEGIKPTCLCGASMGALIGIFYATGLSAHDICEMIKDEKLYNLVKIFNPTVGAGIVKPGLSSHKTLRQLFKKYIPYEKFEDLPLEFGVSATNISKQRCEYVSSGEKLKEYVLASMTQPAVFNPIVINGDYFIDGGVLDNMPTKIIRDKCEIVIGIDAHPYSEIFKMRNVFDTAMRSIQTLVHNNSISGRELCDILIEPMACENYTIFDYHRFTKIYKYGYRAAVAKLPEILQAL